MSCYLVNLWMCFKHSTHLVSFFSPATANESNRRQIWLYQIAPASFWQQVNSDKQLTRSLIIFKRFCYFCWKCRMSHDWCDGRTRTSFARSRVKSIRFVVVGFIIATKSFVFSCSQIIFLLSPIKPTDSQQTNERSEKKLQKNSFELVFISVSVSDIGDLIKIR